MVEPVEILEFSRDLVKAGWTRGVWAENNTDESVDPTDPSACSFCLLGSVKRAKHVLKATSVEERSAVKALEYVLSTNYPTLIYFNDLQCTEGPVIDLVDRAIVWLKEKKV